MVKGGRIRGYATRGTRIQLDQDKPEPFSEPSWQIFQSFSSQLTMTGETVTIAMSVLYALSRGKLDP